MESRRSCTIAVVLLGVGGMALLLLVGLYYYFVKAPRALEARRLAASPPSMIVHTPLQGDSVPEGSMLSSSATATSRNPISRLELWWDGALYELRAPDPALQNMSTTFHAESAIKMTPGTHLLYWRAIDNSGLVAQSTSIAVTGMSRLAATEVVPAEEGQSLQDIAESLGGEPDVLRELNPNLGEGSLSAGTQVTVPRAGGAAGGEQVPPGNAPSQPLPQPRAGSVTLLPYNPSAIDFGALIPMVIQNQPAAPANLQAGFEPCKIRLTWTDNATNEDGFDIWLQPVGSAPFKVSSTRARPGTGDATFEFPAPRFGIYAVWVEAVNPLGRQASEMQGVFVNVDSCPQPASNQLEIQVVSITVTGGAWHDLYCFVSMEGATEKRVPEDDSAFIQPGALLGGTNLFVVATPVDGELNLSGDCWGWPGPGSMGIFGKAVPSAQWDNRPVHAGDTGYDIEFRVRPFGSTPVHGIFTYTDADLPVPTILSVDARTSQDPLERSRLARNINLKWDWKGPAQAITNFVIAMDGAMEFKWANQADRTVPIVLPSSCGRAYKFAVAAVAPGGARSAYSTWYEYSQPPCERYLEVTFNTFSFSYLDDGEPGETCDDPELELDLGQSQANVPGELAIDCNRKYSFTGLPVETRQITPLGPDRSAAAVWIYFWDHDHFVIDWGRQLICASYREFAIPAVTDSESGTFEHDYTDACPQNVDYTGTFYGRGEVTYHVRVIRGPK